MNRALFFGISCLALSAPFAARAAEAEQAAPEASGRDDIVVTAQKRSENLQDVPMSISAARGDDLAQANITSITDLPSRIPNLTVGNQQGQANIFIRGIGLDNNFAGADPSVALHVDGAVISQSSAQLGAFLDLARVEVLRGPQGTLYGRNSTGGTVNLITNKPTDEAGGYVRATLGNYDNVIVEAAVGGPLIGDKILGRIAVRTENRSGYGVNEFTGQDIDDAKKRSIRAQLLFNFSPDVDLLLSGELHRESDAAYAYKFKSIAYPGATIPSLMPVATSGFATDPRHIRSEAQFRNDRDTWALTSLLNINIDEYWTLRSITNYRHTSSNPLQDLDMSSVVTPSLQNNYMTGHQFSQEAQLSVDKGPFKAIVAAYYFTEHLYGDNSVGFEPSRNLSPADRRYRLSFAGTVDTRSYALFGEGTYRFSPQFALTLGGRITYEKRKGDSLFTVKPGAIPIVTPYQTAGDFTSVTPKATVEWTPKEDVSLYGTYSRGFKSGIILTGQINPILKPETVQNFEIGLKSRWFDRSLTANISAFHVDFTDLQVGRTQVGATPASIQTIFENAASAKIDGIEGQLSWNPHGHGLGIDLSGGWLNARYADYMTADALDLPNALLIQRKGNKLSQSPTWSAVLNVEYDFELGSGALITPYVNADYKSRIFFSASNNDRITQGARTLFNAGLRYQSPDSRFSASIWGRNLTDELVSAGTALLSTSRLILATYTPPRTYGITLGYNF